MYVSKKHVLLFFLSTSFLYANRLQPAQQNKSLYRLTGILLRGAQTMAGVHMLLYNSPGVADFFYVSEIEHEWHPRWHDGWFLKKRPTTRIKKRSVVPEGILVILKCIPTRAVGLPLMLDGIRGLLKELDKSGEAHQKKRV